jgi:hypothetical protein
MIRRIIAAAATVAALSFAAVPPAQALQPGWERGTVPTILGVPKCIATKSAVRIYGVPKTKPGEVCAVRVWATYHRGNRTDYERANRATSSWEYVGLLYTDDGRYVADLVRRPPS